MVSLSGRTLFADGRGSVPAETRGGWPPRHEDGDGTYRHVL